MQEVEGDQGGGENEDEGGLCDEHRGENGEGDEMSYDGMVSWWDEAEAGS